MRAFGQNEQTAAVDLYRAFAQHPGFYLLVAAAILFILRQSLQQARRSWVLPSLIWLKRSRREFWSRAKHHGQRAIHRWHEITLYSNWDAPSRLVFGLLGASIVGLSLELSYRGLLPNLFRAAEIASLPKDRFQSVLLFNLSGHRTQTLVIFEAAIGFVCLEMFGITNVFRFANRYPFPNFRRTAASFLVVVLLGFGVDEAWMTLLSNEQHFDNACQKFTALPPICANGVGPYRLLFPNHRWATVQGEAAPNRGAPGTLTSSPRTLARETLSNPNADSQLLQRQFRDLRLRAVEFYSAQTWLDIAFALLMPFTLMIVGLALDFFEEMYLPTISLLFCFFFTAAALVCAVLLVGGTALLYLAGAAATVLLFPLDAARATATRAVHGLRRRPGSA